MFNALLRDLRSDAWFQEAVTASRVQSAADAVCVDVELRADLRSALRRLGIERLYRHQAEVLGHVRAGRNVVVATPTASGKTLCFNLPVVESILAARECDQEVHALYLFPLKALEHDQLKNLYRLRDAIGLQESFRAAIFDGDTKDAERRRGW